MAEEMEFEEMAQIPENIGYEETLVGPLTKTQVAKLFFPAIIGIGISYAFHLPTLFKFAAAGSCILIGAVFAFIKVGGVPPEKLFVNWLSYRARTRQAHCPDGDSRDATKGFVDLEKVQEGTVKLHGEMYVKVVEIEGINFEFMSCAERANIIAGYEQFLNSIEGNVQVVARPERFSPKEYLQFVSNRIDEVDGKDEKVKAALEDYMVFFEKFAQGIIVHRFYAVVSVNLAIDAGEFLENNPETTQRFEKACELLTIRASNVVAGLNGMTLRARELDTGEVIALFRRYYGGGL
jgi:hypothetical protein